MSKREKKKNAKKETSNPSVKALPFSIILFLIVAVTSGVIVLNKGKIAGYSLVKIQSTDFGENVENEEEIIEDKLEISTDSKYLSCKSKETGELTVLLNGEEVDKSELEFESSDDEVIEVDEEGIIKAISVGKATITAKKDDLTASIDIRGIIPIKSMTFTTTNSVIRVGKSLQMKLVATPSDANIETLKYTSSDEDIATVNANGIVTGVASGKVTITVTDTYSNLEKKVNLTIKN